ncbi:MAG: hypothetical protein ACOYUZ_00360 [Patescibacteria group bacterium]
MTEEYRKVKSYWFVCWKPERSENMFDEVIELEGNDFSLPKAKMQVTIPKNAFLLDTASAKFVDMAAGNFMV